MYAAFGQVSRGRDRLANEQLFRYGVLSDPPTVLGTLNTGHRPRCRCWSPCWSASTCSAGWSICCTIAPARGCLGLAVVLIESFFLLVVIMGGIRVLQNVPALAAPAGPSCMAGRSVEDAIAELLAVLSIDLPAILTGSATSSPTRSGRSSWRR